MTPAEEQFQALPKEKVSITNGTDTASVDAVIARSKMVVESNAGAILQVPSHDFIVRARDLVMGNVVATPAKGWKVTRVFCGKTYTYQLMTPPFDPHDHAGSFYRLHSKQISAV